MSLKFSSATFLVLSSFLVIPSKVSLLLVLTTLIIITILRERFVKFARHFAGRSKVRKIITSENLLVERKALKPTVFFCFRTFHLLIEKSIQNLYSQRFTRYYTLLDRIEILIMLFSNYSFLLNIQYFNSEWKKWDFKIDSRERKINISLENMLHVSPRI